MISTRKHYLLIFVSIFFMQSCNQLDLPETQVQLRPVRTLKIERQDSQKKHEFIAVVDSSRKADLSFKVSGQLVEMLVHPGDKVVKGQLIARLDDSDIKIQLTEAEVIFDKARADFERAKNLIKASNISESDYDQLKSQYQSSMAKLNAAKNNLNYTQLSASFDGVIAKKYTENFQEISAKTPIVALHDLDTISLKVDIPENIMIRSTKNDQKNAIHARFDQIEGIEFPLEFLEISTQADEITNTYEVIFTMKSPKNYTILPGMAARVIARHNKDASSGTYYVPAQSVLNDGVQNYLFRVTSMGDATGKVTRRLITIGDIGPYGIEVISGIEEGDHVITAGMSKITDGMLVKF